MRQAALFTILACLLLPVTAAAVTVPHKALYKMKTLSVEQGSSISGADGQLYYEQDDTCDAWTAEHRFSVDYQYPERNPVRNTSHYVSWEAKDGGQFYFNSTRQQDGEVVQQLRGSVMRQQDGAALAEYGRPEGLSFTLPAGYMLPFQHTAEILRRTQGGGRFFTVTLFDGTDAEGPVEVSAVIGKRLSAADVDALLKGSGGKIDRALLAAPAHRVHLAFFQRENKAAIVPAYEMDIVLHDNSVISHAVVDYKSFRMEQRLDALETLPARPCQPEEKKK